MWCENKCLCVCVVECFVDVVVFVFRGGPAFVGVYCDD